MNEFAVHVGATGGAVDALAHFDSQVLLDAGVNPNEGVRLFVCGGLVYK